MVCKHFPVLRMVCSSQPTANYALASQRRWSIFFASSPSCRGGFRENKRLLSQQLEVLERKLGADSFRNPDLEGNISDHTISRTLQRIMEMQVKVFH